MPVTGSHWEGRELKDIFSSVRDLEFNPDAKGSEDRRFIM